jgi:hypothetical protein
VPETSAHSRNLLILHTPPDQALSDWEAVQRKVRERAPDIDVRIGSNVEPDEAVRQWQVTRPSLVFSPIHLVRYRPPGGKVYAGHNFPDKMRETDILAAAGLPVPESRILTRALFLNPATWGEYTVVKPNIHASLGVNIRLVRTDSIALRYTELSLNEQRQMIVQRFVDSVDEKNRVFCHRVLTLFGRPVSAVTMRWKRPRRPLAEIAADPVGGIASQHWAEKKEREKFNEPDVLALASRTAGALPDIPCLGVDIIRERGSGALFVLETNPGGNTWHFSSTYGMRAETKDRKKSYDQFKVLDVAAETLIEKTRTEAC